MHPQLSSARLYIAQQRSAVRCRALPFVLQCCMVRRCGSFEHTAAVASSSCSTRYKGFARGRLDAARYARARQGRMQLKTCEGGRKKGPTIWRRQRFDNAKSCLCKANCLVVLSCVVCFWYRCYVLIGGTGVLCVGEKTGCRARSNTCRKIKKIKV